MNATKTVSVRPFGDHILVEPLLEDETTEGGIVLPDATRKEIDQGIVRAVGPGRRLPDGSLVPMEVSEGQRVVYQRYAGKKVQLPGRREFYLMRASDCYGALEESDEQGG